MTRTATVRVGTAAQGRFRAGWQHKGEELRPGIDFKPFYIPRCANRDCRQPLQDQHGEPSWDIIGGRFVCRPGCGFRSTPRPAPRYM